MTIKYYESAFHAIYPKERADMEVKVIEASVELFEGDWTAAARWLTQHKELSCEELLDLIGRLEHGVF